LNRKRKISKWIKAAAAVLVACLTVLLFTGAAGERSTGKCTGYQVKIKGVEKHYFIDEKEVVRLLKKATNGAVTGQPLSDFDLEQLESVLRRNAWIEDAELYFNNDYKLYVDITEKEPVARVYTTQGQSFYVDKNGIRMPLSANKTAHVPVFTDIPDFKKPARRDSQLLKSVARVADYVAKDEFWSAQAEQFALKGKTEFEMVPLIGDHLVCIGDDSNLDKKFHRLRVFYQQVLRYTGFDKYSYINVQYSGQIVATRRDNAAATR